MVEMSAGTHTPFHLRQNKSVDRELFLGLLSKLGSCLDIDCYRYLGMGGAFLEDFRLVHARLGLKDLVCVESREAVYKRQLFNCPVSCITLEHNTIEQYINITEFDNPVILWLDYTNSKGLKGKINIFCQYSKELPIGSVLRITLNANSNFFDKASDEKDFEGLNPKDIMEERHARRLRRFELELGDIVPIDLGRSDMNRKHYGVSLLRALKNAVNGKLNNTDRRAVWALSTHYADVEEMVTATIVICRNDNALVEDTINSWEHLSGPEDPLVLDMPVLSTLERLTMESSEDPKKKMGYELPKSNMGKDPFVSFRKYYRFFPHFSRVEP